MSSNLLLIGDKRWQNFIQQKLMVTIGVLVAALGNGELGIHIAQRYMVTQSALN